MVQSDSAQHDDLAGSATEERLGDLVAGRAQAFVVLHPAATMLQACFAAFDHNTVTFRLYTPVPDVAPGAVACVHITGRSDAAFLTPVLLHAVTEQGPELVVRRPADVATLDKRSAFRVPAPPHTYAATLSFGGATVTGWVTDLSVYGAQIMIDSTKARIVFGQRLVLAIQASPAGSTLSIGARVARRTAEGCGLTLRPGADDKPPPELVALVRHAERAWVYRTRPPSLEV